MGLILHKLRVFIRTNFAPIHPVTAEKWSRRLKTIYMLLAWNIFGFAAWTVWSSKDDKKAGNIPSSIFYAKQFDISNAKVIKISGFNVETKDITKEDIDREYGVNE